MIERERPAALGEAIARLKDKLVAEPPTVATRKASEMVLEVLVAGDAGTAARLGRPHPVQQHPHQGPQGNRRPADFSGRYIHYGIREIGMAAAMNGIAAHGGFAPAGGTFLCFTDYARPVDADRGAVAHPGRLRHDP